MPLATKQYTDIDLNFEPHPVTGDISLLTDEDAVIRSVKNLVATGNYERIFRPDLGCNVQQQLFEPASALLEYKLREAIIGVLEIYEPRIDLHDVLVFIETDALVVRVVAIFTIVNLTKDFKVEIFLERVR